MRERNITVLMIEPQETPVISTLGTTMEAFNRAVSIGSSEIGAAKAKKLSAGIYAIFNRAGLFSDLQANRKIDDEIISGVIYIVGVDAQYQPRSLTCREIEKYSDFFWFPEYYSYSEVLSNYSDSLLRELDELE